MSLVEWCAVLLGMLCLVGWRLAYLEHVEVLALREERRKLNYELMQSCVALCAERDRASALHARYRLKREAAAAEIAELKQGVVDALDLLAAYRAVGIEPAHTPLPALRDRLSQFGRAFEGEPTGPMDLAERKEWLG